uniref:Uncharacterized protein n=2 Tax=Cacopsylla melanoneura TaxID=428564 RepID=A0A8D8PX62_9HEMI
MMLTHREHFNVLDNDHLVVVLVEDGVIQDLFQRLVVALGEEKHSFGSSFGGLQQSLSVRVLTQGAQQTSVGGGHVGEEGLSGWGLVVQLQVVVEGAFLVAVIILLFNESSIGVSVGGGDHLGVTGFHDFFHFDFFFFFYKSRGWTHVYLGRYVIEIITTTTTTTTTKTTSTTPKTSTTTTTTTGIASVHLVIRRVSV